MSSIDRIKTFHGKWFIVSKKGTAAHLVNNSWGPVLNQLALKKALQQKIIAGVAFDDYESEPLEDLEFISFPNFMVIHYIGGNANEALLTMGRPTVGHLKEYFLDSNTWTSEYSSLKQYWLQGTLVSKVHGWLCGWNRLGQKLLELH